MDTQTAESLLTFAEGAGPALRGPDARAVFEQLEQQHNDLLAALH